MTSKIKTKYNNTVNKINYEFQLVKTVNDFKRYADLNITNIGELIFVYDNIINMKVVIPGDPILKKIYAMYGEKTTINDFISASKKKFTINGKQKNISALSANIVFRLIDKELRRRQL